MKRDLQKRRMHTKRVIRKRRKMKELKGNSERNVYILAKEACICEKIRIKALLNGKTARECRTECGKMYV